MSRRKKLSPEVEQQFKALAATDWEEFKRLTGVDLLKAFLCMQRQKGRSLGAIANNTGIPKTTVQDICKKCN